MYERYQSSLGIQDRLVRLVTAVDEFSTCRDLYSDRRCLNSVSILESGEMSTCQAF
jgi:hypothetical protein